MTSDYAAKPSRCDGILESSVIGSFTKIGYRIRSRNWEDINGAALENRVVIITGATSGIGKEVATSIAGHGARLRFIARDPAKAATLRSDLVASSGNQNISFYIADLSIRQSVRDVAAQILTHEEEIHVLINNAAILPAERIVTSDGLELSNATNLVAPFILTNELIPRLRLSQPARIINVVSGGMYSQGLDLEDLNYAQGEYRGSIAYARAKRGLMVLTKMWADRLAGTAVTVNATHPGWVSTPGVKESLPGFHRLMKPLLRDPAQGADTIMWLATSDRVAAVSGRLWHDRLDRSEYKLRRTIETSADRTRLWDMLAETAQPG